MAFRIVHWTTGNVGIQSVEAVLAHPDLEPVGCYAWSPDKVGRDVGGRVHGACHGDDRDARDQRHPRVIAAPPGIAPYTTLPLPLPRGLVTL